MGIDHGEKVVKAAADGLAAAGLASCPPEKLCFSVKVAGLHWHVMHKSRATEACAGYDCSSELKADAYHNIALMLQRASVAVKRPVLFNFTCMEMTNFKYGEGDQLSAPEDLIA